MNERKIAMTHDLSGTHLDRDHERRRVCTPLSIVNTFVMLL